MAASQYEVLVETVFRIVQVGRFPRHIHQMLPNFSKNIEVITLKDPEKSERVFAKICEQQVVERREQARCVPDSTH